MDKGVAPTYIQPSQATEHHPLPATVFTDKGSDVHPPGCACMTCYMRAYRHLDIPGHREKLNENGRRHTELWRLSQAIGPDEFTIFRYQKVVLPLEIIHTILTKTEEFPYLGSFFARVFPTGSKLVTWPRRSIRRWHRKLRITYTKQKYVFLDARPLRYVISARRKKNQFNLYVIEAYRGHSPSDFDDQGVNPETPCWDSKSYEHVYEGFKRVQNLLGVDAPVIESSYLHAYQNWPENSEAYQELLSFFESIKKETGKREREQAQLARTEEKVRGVKENYREEYDQP